MVCKLIQGRLDVSPDGTPLYDAGARFYAPYLGMFSQLDSVTGQPTDPRSMNRFAYAEANPWTFSDPSGHATCFSTTDLCDEQMAIQHHDSQAGRDAARRGASRDKTNHWYDLALKAKAPGRDYDSNPKATPTGSTSPGAPTTRTETSDATGVIVLATDVTEIPFQPFSIKDNRVDGMAWEDYVYGEYLEMYPPPRYTVLRSYSIKNAAGQSVRFGPGKGKISKPDIQVIDNQTDSLVAVGEAGSGTGGYLGAKETKIRGQYETVLEKAGTPKEVDRWLALRGRTPGFLSGLSIAVNAFSLIDIVAQEIEYETLRDVYGPTPPCEVLYMSGCHMSGIY